MKKIVAIAGAFALAACGGAETEEVADAGDDTLAVDPGADLAVNSAAGTYSGNTDTGGSWSTTLNPNGTFTDSENGEVLRTGTWTQTEEEGVCFVEDGALDTTPECYQMGEASEDGTVSWTGPDGQEFTMNKTS